MPAKDKDEPGTPPGPAAAPAIVDPQDRAPVYPTRWYWIILAVSVATLLVALWFKAVYLHFIAEWLRLATIALSLVVILFVVIALMRRGRVIHRTGRALKHAATGISEGIQQQGEAAEGKLGQFFTKLAKFLKWIVLLPIRILIWAWYTGEKLFWHILLILYDVVYYPLYAAWILTLFAFRVAFRIVVFALKVAWKILRIPTFIWPIKGWWRTKKRPEILAAWRAFLKHRDHLRATRIDRLRRLHVLKGEDPDRWQADYELRRGFPLPHPEGARKAIRKRIDFINEVQRARREGRPIPRHKKDGEAGGLLGKLKRKEKKEEAPPAAEPKPEEPAAESKPKRKRKGKDAAEPSTV